MRKQLLQLDPLELTQTLPTPPLTAFEERPPLDVAARAREIVRG
jgi:hypothetical protein